MLKIKITTTFKLLLAEIANLTHRHVRSGAKDSNIFISKKV